MKFKNFVPFVIAVIFMASSCSQQSSKVTETKADFSNTLTAEELSGGRLTPEILWKFGRVSDHQLSPDGSTIIYNITRYDAATNLHQTNIFKISAEGGEPQILCEGSNMRWKPESDLIGYISSESGSDQIWEMNQDGSGKIQITDIPGGINSFEYAPNGKLLYYVKDVKMEKTPQEIYPDLPLTNVRIIDDLMYRHWNAWSDYAYSHIFIAAMDGPVIKEGRDILEGEPFDTPLSPYFDASEISWSSDSKSIAYTCKKMKGRDYAVSTNSDIYLYNLESETTENLSQGMPGYDKFPRFSPDGTKIAWQSMSTPGYEADKARLIVMDLKTREKKDLTKNFDQDVANILWGDDNTTIYFISGYHAAFQVYKINTLDGAITAITKGNHDYTAFSVAGNVITGERMTMSMAPEIFKINPENGEESQLTFTNKNIYDAVKMGKVEERWVKTTDNKQMLVWVIYPPDFDSTKKYPALLYCQGGPQSAVSQFWSFRWNFQIMAANDYIIVAPNRRGLPTFGEEWNRQISGDYGGQNMKDYLSAIDAVSKEPYVNKDKLGAVGASYGGYSVFYLAGHHEGRFKAFISHCGIYNLESMYGATEETFFVNFDNGGPYWANPKPVGYKYSPHLFVNKWDTPIMIITGEMDLRVPYTQSLEAFNAAQLRGIPSKLLVFPEETHFVTKPQNAILWQREFFGWLDKWLK
ncbi:MAG: S9 family peptidase [Bacteroidales bacterium]|nr:S9 family peptidase [Bacteroidales bacterium]